MTVTAIASNTAPAPTRRVPFLDLRINDEDEREAMLAALTRVMDHGVFVLGPEVERFEAQAAAYCARRHCVGVGSGTDALILGLKALGIGEGDEVITTPLSWLATGSAILLNGASAVFGDIGEDLNLDPDTVESLITERTKAILAVHFTGAMADMDRLSQIARKHGLLLIEDGAQAFGGRLGEQPCGGLGDLSCISLNAMKVMAGLGDGGLVLTNDPAVDERLRRLRHSGVVDRDTCLELSHNCRLDALQAAFLQTRLAGLEARIRRRRELAQVYGVALRGVVSTFPERPGRRNVYYTYQIRTPERDVLRDHLEARGVQVRIQHPLVMNDQPAFAGRVRGESPKARAVVDEILCLPMHEKMTEADQAYVIAQVRGFFGR